MILTLVAALLILTPGLCAKVIPKESANSQDDSEMDLIAERVEFNPVDLPIEFEKYDILEVDGYITLEELVKVSEAEENAARVMKDSDTDGETEFSLNQFHIKV